jgi:transcriptional regulator with XRE-family HTH domain
MKDKTPKKTVDAVIQKLTERRKQLGYSHQKVADLSGLNRSAISLIEARKREPTVLTLIRIANVLEIEVKSLFQ